MASENTQASAEPPLKQRPVVLLLLDGWGVAPQSEANAFSSAKIPAFLNLSQEYPVALLNPGNKSLNTRYLILGAGREFSHADEMPSLTLSSVLSAASLTQIKITETERLAALTHFFNGHAEYKANGEDWKIVSSAAADKTIKPLLALKRAVKESLREITADKTRDFIAIAIPYLDLVAASGDLETVKKAIENLDKYLRQIVSAVLSKDGVLIISAAAGNVEHIHNLSTDLADTAMTDNPVPLIIVGSEFKGKTIGLAEPLSGDLSVLAPAGTLADIAPTILSILGLAKPDEMTGESLLGKS